MHPPTLYRGARSCWVTAYPCSVARVREGTLTLFRFGSTPVTLHYACTSTKVISCILFLTGSVIQDTPQLQRGQSFTKNSQADLKDVATSLKSVPWLKTAAKSLMLIDEACAKMSANKFVLSLCVLRDRLFTSFQRAQAKQLAQRCAFLLKTIKDIEQTSRLSQTELEWCLPLAISLALRVFLAH
jgi:hypothetical protein